MAKRLALDPYIVDTLMRELIAPARAGATVAAIYQVHETWKR